MRGVALIAVVLSAVVSIGLMLHVGEYRLNLLMLLFAVWDLSPFAALTVAGVASKRWPKITRTALYGVMLCRRRVRYGLRTCCVEETGAPRFCVSGGATRLMDAFDYSCSRSPCDFYQELRSSAVIPGLTPFVPSRGYLPSCGGAISNLTSTSNGRKFE
jgi:hypothetical protein